MPLFAKAARPHRQTAGSKWGVDETYCRLNGRCARLYRAIDQDEQVVDACFSEWGYTVVGERFFKRTVDETGVQLKQS